MSAKAQDEAKSEPRSKRGAPITTPTTITLDAGLGEFVINLTGGTFHCPPTDCGSVG
jgi:hypothetical protein